MEHLPCQGKRQEDVEALIEDGDSNTLTVLESLPTYFSKFVDPSVKYPPMNVNDWEKMECHFERSPLYQTWAALEECVQEGY